MSSAVRFVVAAAIVALFGGFLVSGTLLVKPDEEPAPAVASSAPVETPVVPSPRAVESGPVPSQPVDWVTVEDDPAFKDSWNMGGDMLTDVALAPGGGAVIVGFDGSARGLGRSTRGRIWWSASGGDWRQGTLPDALGARPRRVVATKDGWVAIGERKRRRRGRVRSRRVRLDVERRHRLVRRHLRTGRSSRISTASTTRWPSLGEQVRVRPTVWTSRSGGPWEAATIAERSSGFSPEPARRLRGRRLPGPRQRHGGRSSAPRTGFGSRPWTCPTASRQGTKAGTSAR